MKCPARAPGWEAYACVCGADVVKAPMIATGATPTFGGAVAAGCQSSALTYAHWVHGGVVQENSEASCFTIAVAQSRRVEGSKVAVHNAFPDRRFRP